MPKGNRRNHLHHNKENRRKIEVSSDDESELLDSASAVDSISIAATDGSGSIESDELTAQENLENKLLCSLDGMSSKSVKVRVDLMLAVKNTFCQKYLFDFVYKSKMTICMCVERCLKRGKGVEQQLAAQCSALLLVQLGSLTENNDIFESLLPHLKVAAADSTIPNADRSVLVEALGHCTFIAADDLVDIMDVMSILEKIFKQSYLKCDGLPPSHAPDVSHLHTCALEAWTLLLTILPSSFAQAHLDKVSGLLFNSDVHLRIAAGECIALSYERIRNEDEDFEGEGFSDLCIKLKSLSTESHKYQAKKDRREQKSCFRDVLSTVELGDYAKERLKLSHFESISIDCWTIHIQYNAMCRILGPGIHIHLQENDLLRDIFDLGAPIPLASMPTLKISKLEKTKYHGAAFKARSKKRNQQRDNKAMATEF